MVFIFISGRCNIFYVYF